MKTSLIRDFVTDILVPIKVDGKYLVSNTHRVFKEVIPRKIITVKRAKDGRQFNFIEWRDVNEDKFEWMLLDDYTLIAEITNE